MARPERHDADYFPFYAKDGRTLHILEEKYGCKGTGFFTNVMRFLTLQTDHHFCIADPSDYLYFFSKCKCDEESGIDMLNIMSKTHKIHSDLWVSYRVIVSQDLLNSLKDAYRNRNNRIITIDEIMVSYVDKPQVPDVSYVDNPNSGGISDEFPTSESLKGKETKGKKKIYSQNSNEFRLANFLLSLIIERRNSFKKPDLQKWCIHIDRMIRIDKRIPTEIEKVIRWCQQDDFWQNNILSTQKLREQFDQLALKIPQTKSEKTPGEKPLTDEEIRENERLSGLYKRMKLRGFDD